MSIERESDWILLSSFAGVLYLLLHLDGFLEGGQLHVHLQAVWNTCGCVCNYLHSFFIGRWQVLDVDDRGRGRLLLVGSWDWGTAKDPVFLVWLLLIFEFKPQNLVEAMARLYKAMATKTTTAKAAQPPGTLKIEDSWSILMLLYWSLIKATSICPKGFQYFYK